MNGIIVNAKHVHGKHAKINPIPHHYEGPGEKPYIKWHCQGNFNIYSRRLAIERRTV